MILLMILFHLNYSLTQIFGSEIINFSDSFWQILGKTSALGFMIISWISFFLAREKYGDKITNRYFKYAGILGLLALSISLVTAVFIPEQIILFGILHLFAVSFALLPLLAKSEYYSWVLALWIICVSFIFPLQVSNQFLFPLWLTSSGFYSADYYPLFPYLWYLLWWFFLAKCMRRYDIFTYFWVNRPLVWVERLLSYMWKRSLLLYLIHQPIIITILYVLFKYIFV